MTVARVFPRRTSATPSDQLAFVGDPGLFHPEIDMVHVSVTFTWDVPEAERLAAAWSRVAPVEIGGPALGSRGESFRPGMYLRDGLVITSRGCPNRCWFCDVPSREGREVRTLPIVDGWNVLDSNLLACPEEHVRQVFDMLSRQANRPVFSGGLEAARLLRWQAERLREIRTDRMYFAYDTADDLEPLVCAGKLLREVGFTRHHMACYVLMGWPTDTMERAQTRLRQAWDAGFVPMAMLWNRRADAEWRRLQRAYARPAITKAIFREQDTSWAETALGRWALAQEREDR